MERIGKLLVAAVSLWVISVLPASLNNPVKAQSSASGDISVEATVSETTIYTGERISLSVKVSGNFTDVSRPTLPDFPGFRLLSSTPSTSRSYSYVNGQSSTSYSYSYYLVAQQEGRHTIPSITVSIDDQTYRTDPIDVDIVDRNESAEDARSNSRPEIFLRMEISDETPVTGQQLIGDIVLFFKDGLEVNSYQPIPGWKAEGFWKEEIENTQRPRAESVILNGVRYRKARLLQFALFPTKSGELTISPYEIVVSVRSSSDRNDPFSSFFGGFGGNQQQVELKTAPVNLNVRSLPEIENASFIGAVGDYSITRKAQTQNALVGETIEVATTIRGTGNIPLITKPVYELPEGLEVYEPQENSNINRRNQQISGTKTFTDVVIARAPGSFTIPEKTVAYYNPSRGGYVRETLPAIELTVSRNPEADIAEEQTPLLGIKPVTGLASWSEPDSRPLSSRWWLWVGLLLPLLVLGVAYWQKSYIEKMSRDTAFARSQRASDRAGQRLEEAIACSERGDTREAYNKLQKALTGFIGDKLNLPEAGHSNEVYVRALEENNIDENLVRNTKMLLDKCASISYAPDVNHDYLKSHVGLAESILDKLKKEL